jgi:hypothetical protein
MEHLGSHWADFYELNILAFFEKSVKEIEVYLKSVKNNGYFTRRPIYVYDHISLSSSKNDKSFRQNCRESQNTFLVHNFFF